MAIYTIGETVFDIMFKNNTPYDGKPGGSQLNSAVTLGRLGAEVYFISEAGEDKLGGVIAEFLVQNSVKTDYFFLNPLAKTAMALAFLDSEGNASYDFYRLHPEKRFEMKLPKLTPADILLFGSSFAIMSEVRKPLVTLLNAAKDNGVTIIYDPNFRKVHLPELEQILPLISENISFSDIVRGSDEDFLMIFGATDCDEAYKNIKNLGCEHFIYTKGANGVALRTPNIQKNYDAKPIKTVSTIGAGDGFNAAIIHRLQGRKPKALGNTDWDKMIETGILISAEICKSSENYLCLMVNDE